MSEDENLCLNCDRRTLRISFTYDDDLTTIEHFCQGCGDYHVYEYEPNPALGIGERFILSDFDKALKMNLNRVVSVLGPPGSGKSWTGLKFGSYCDPKFSLDDVVFSGIDYIKAISDKNRKGGSFVLWDDAGLGAPARKYMSPENIGVGMVAQSSRFRRIRVWTTVPDRSFLDNQPRKLVDIHLEFNRRFDLNSPISFKIFYPELNPRRGKVYYKHPRIYVPKRGPLAISVITIKDPPKKSLREAYEEKKEKYLMDNFYPNLIKQLEDGISDQDIRTDKYLILLYEYSKELGITRTELAKRLGVRLDSLSRAYGRAKNRSSLT